MAIPIVLDTDIGLDVDDVWALAFLLKCPELDVKLILTNTGDTRYSACLVAKLLQIAGRADIAIGIGVPVDPNLPRTHAAWLDDYDINQYRGPVFEDGVGALIDVVKNSPDMVTIIEIGPTRNLAEAISRHPAIAQKARLIAMLGSLRKGYRGAGEPAREYNAFKDAKSCRIALEAPWDITLVPLDTCGTVSLRGERFDRLRACDDPLVHAVLENHFLWADAVRGWQPMKDFDANAGPSILYDTVPVYLAFSDHLLSMEDLHVRVTDDGWTKIDDAGAHMRCATGWADQDGFADFLVERLIAAPHDVAQRHASAAPLQQAKAQG